MKDRRVQKFLFTALTAAMFPTIALAQVQSSPNSTTNPLYGSVTTGPPVATVLPLSLDDAIHRGLEHNLRMVIAAQNQRTAAGKKLQAINYLTPTVTWSARRSRNQINLAAEGFRANVFSRFPAGLIPPSELASIPTVVTVNVVSAQANVQQSLFDLRSLELYRAAKEELRAVDLSFQSSRGAVIQAVALSYLQALADAANVANAQGLLAANAEILRQATLKHEAGTVAKLDELRARVQYQQQQQVVIAQQNAFEKAKVALNREIGLPADQQIRLTDPTPYATLDVMPLSQALQEAYANRPDYQRLQAELRSAEYQTRAARFERLPTLSFGGDYGITGTVGGIYHGVFMAQGTLNIPIFREAKFRGDREVADANASNARAQAVNLRNEIEAQLRNDLLDLATTKQLVEVGRSNVDLALASLNDATDRYKNGIDNDLPAVEAQASLAAAQAQLVGSLYQYNQAKLSLARHLGIVDRQYRFYLGNSAQRNSSGAAASAHLNRGSLTPAD